MSRKDYDQVCEKEKLITSPDEYRNVISPRVSPIYFDNVMNWCSVRVTYNERNDGNNNIMPELGDDAYIGSTFKIGNRQRLCADYIEQDMPNQIATCKAMAAEIFGKIEAAVKDEKDAEKKFYIISDIIKPYKINAPKDPNHLPDYPDALGETIKRWTGKIMSGPEGTRFY